MYTVIEADVAIMPKSGAEKEEDSNDTFDLEMVLEDDDRFAAVPEERRMKAFACYEAGKAAEDRRKLQLALAGIEKKLREMEPWAAAREQRKVAGPYSKYLECRVEDGKLTVVRKRNALSFASNREGMFVMFSHGVEDWGSMMSCYD